jgi:hypothetical protein
MKAKSILIALSIVATNAFAGGALLQSIDVPPKLDLGSIVKLKCDVEQGRRRIIVYEYRAGAEVGAAVVVIASGSATTDQISRNTYPGYGAGAALSEQFGDEADPLIGPCTEND